VGRFSDSNYAGSSSYRIKALNKRALVVYSKNHAGEDGKLPDFMGLKK